MAAIYSALTIPTVSSRPSLSCLQWSDDGQIFFLTKGCVYILTPDRGVHPATAQLPDAHHRSHVKWFATMIDFDKQDIHNWPTDSQEWAAVSLGSMDIGLRAISCSPSNLTENGGCIVAVLTSNMDLSFWCPTKNSIKGEWIKICVATPFITDLISQESLSKAAHTLRAQITSICWSSQADFDADPSPLLDASLFVTGTRAGTLMFFRFKNLTLEHLATLEVSENWITHLVFSAWKVIELGKCQISLAFGTADGSVGLVEIIQSLHVSSASSAFFPEYVVEVGLEKRDQAIFGADNLGTTALSCICPLGNMIFVKATPGIVSLWSKESSTLGWSGFRSIVLSTQRFSVGSSSFQPPSGIYYVAQEDTLLVSLFDGSIHVIQSLTKEPRLVDASQSLGDISSQTLSDISRSTFAYAERCEVSKRDMNRVSGMIPFDSSAVVLWAQQSAQPSDFDYKYEAMRDSTFVAARLWKNSTQEIFLRELSTIVNTAKASSGITPLHILRSFFLRRGDLLELLPNVLDILSTGSDAYPSMPALSPWADDIGPSSRLQWRKSLKQHLFGCNILLSLRLRLSVADVCLRNTTDPIKRGECSDVAQALLRTISYIILQILCRHLSVVATCLREAEITFLMRIALQSSFPDAPQQLRSEAENLIDTVCLSLPSVSRETSGQLVMEEQCPACGLPIYLDGDSETCCPNGHSWGRCSATSFILSTPMVKTCIGCNRKVLLPLSCRASGSTSNWLPPHAQNWIVEEFLEAVYRCLFCGNNFVSFA
ncbi:transcription factor IIIC subunit delta N-term-domain-containing protein [Mycena rebaudengoi]|nr:transcription factor IIIC subunit delta N-term-domain-containing protein [Mycena rebaudengoi]